MCPHGTKLAPHPLVRYGSRCLGARVLGCSFLTGPEVPSALAGTHRTAPAMGSGSGRHLDCTCRALCASRVAVRRQKKKSFLPSRLSSHSLPFQSNTRFVLCLFWPLVFVAHIEVLGSALLSTSGFQGGLLFPLTSAKRPFFLSSTILLFDLPLFDPSTKLAPTTRHASQPPTFVRDIEHIPPGPVLCLSLRVPTAHFACRRAAFLSPPIASYLRPACASKIQYRSCTRRNYIRRILDQASRYFRFGCKFWP